MDWRHADELLAAGREVYSELKNIVVWVKNNAGMGSLYRSQHELVFVFKSGQQPARAAPDRKAHCSISYESNFPEVQPRATGLRLSLATPI
jgi:hypothetical protein